MVLKKPVPNIRENVNSSENYDVLRCVSPLGENFIFKVLASSQQRLSSTHYKRLVLGVNMWDAKAYSGTTGHNHIRKSKHARTSRTSTSNV